MNHDVMLIGPACRDENIDYDGTVVRGVGGAVFFCDFAVRASGADVFSAVKINEKDTDIIDSFETDSSHIALLPSRLTTLMRNTYTTPTRETRIAECLAQSDPILPAEIPDEPSTIYHLAGLLYGDFPLELITELAKKGKVSADIQGFLRHNENGSMNFHDWDVKKDYLKYFDFLKTDAAEAKIMTGTEDRLEAAKQMIAWGVKEVVITHNTEVLAYDGTEAFTCPIKARNLSGRTGRGDTTMGSYLGCRAKGLSIPESLRFATACVSLKMEQPGPVKATREDVEAYLAEFYD